MGKAKRNIVPRNSPPEIHPDLQSQADESMRQFHEFTAKQQKEGIALVANAFPGAVGLFDGITKAIAERSPEPVYLGLFVNVPARSITRSGFAGQVAKFGTRHRAWDLF